MTRLITGLEKTLQTIRSQFEVRTVFNEVDWLVWQTRRGEIKLENFRETPWSFSPEKSSQYIEAILVGHPVYPMTLRDANEHMVVQDGHKRITALLQFINQGVVLSNCNILPELNGLAYHDLPYSVQRAFANRKFIFYIFASR